MSGESSTGFNSYRPMSNTESSPRTTLSTSSRSSRSAPSVSSHTSPSSLYQPFEPPNSENTSDSPLGLARTRTFNDFMVNLDPGFIPPTQFVSSTRGPQDSVAPNLNLDDDYWYGPWAEAQAQGGLYRTQRSPTERSTAWMIQFQTHMGQALIGQTHIQPTNAPPINTLLFNANNATGPRYQPLAPISREQVQARNQESIDHRRPRIEIPRSSRARNSGTAAIYECSICHRTLTRESDLDRHIETIHGKKYYRCGAPRCRHQCNRRDKMKEHVKRVHKNRSVDIIEAYDD